MAGMVAGELVGALEAAGFVIMRKRPAEGYSQGVGPTDVEGRLVFLVHCEGAGKTWIRDRPPNPLNATPGTSAKPADPCRPLK